MRRSADDRGKCLPQLRFEGYGGRLSPVWRQLHRELPQMSGDPFGCHCRGGSEGIHGRVTCLLQISLLKLCTSQPERVKGAAALVGTALAVKCLGDEGFRNLRLTQSGMRDSGIDGELVLIEVRHPRWVGVAVRDLLELSVSLTDGCMRPTAAAQCGVCEGFSHGQHGQHAGVPPIARAWS